MCHYAAPGVFHSRQVVCLKLAIYRKFFWAMTFVIRHVFMGRRKIAAITLPKSFDKISLFFPKNQVMFRKNQHICYVTVITIKLAHISERCKSWELIVFLHFLLLSMSHGNVPLLRHKINSKKHPPYRNITFGSTTPSNVTKHTRGRFLGCCQPIHLHWSFFARQQQQYVEASNSLTLCFTQTK